MGAFTEIIPPVPKPQNYPPTSFGPIPGNKQPYGPPSLIFIRFLLPKAGSPVSRAAAAVMVMDIVMRLSQRFTQIHGCRFRKSPRKTGWVPDCSNFELGSD